MKLKYYMRGLGIGIAVTALLMGIALSGRKETMTDDEIRQRALEMGMTDDSGVLSEDLGDETQEAEPGEAEAGETEAEEKEPEAAVPAVSVNETGAMEEETEEPDEEKSDIPQNEEKSIIITINSGDGSRTVSNKLKEAGLIRDAAAYDAFLCQNGYDKKIAAGSHEILPGASEEEIAIALTRRGN